MNVDTTITLAEDLEDDMPKPLSSAARPSLTNLPPPPKRRCSIKDRFEDAKKEQQRKEEQRLEQLKHKDALSPKGNVAGMWNNALANSKTNEAERYQAKRMETISQFQTAEAAGIVADRVKHFEELYMQLAASIEKMEATIRAARRNAKKWKMAATSPSRVAAAGASGVPEENTGIRMRLGETATFWFDPQYFSYVNAMLAKNNNEPISLPTGVYSDETAPHIDVVAVCILDTSSNEPYLALTVDYCDGHAGDPLALGRKKIAVFANDHLKPSTGVEELVQVFSELFLILSPEDTGATAFEMTDADDENIENDIISSDDVIASTDEADIDASDFAEDQSNGAAAGAFGESSGDREHRDATGGLCAEGADENGLDEEEELERTLIDDSKESLDLTTENALDDTLIDPALDISDLNLKEDSPNADLGLLASSFDLDEPVGDRGTDDSNAAVENNADNDVEERTKSQDIRNAAFAAGGDEEAAEIDDEKGDVFDEPMMGSPTQDEGQPMSGEELPTTPGVHDNDTPASIDDDHTPASRSSAVHSVSEADDFVSADLKSPLTTKNRLKSSSNVGMVFSFSGLGSIAPEVRASVVIRADSQKVSQQESARRLSWDAKDEREMDLPVVQKINVNFDMISMLSVSCSSSCCLFICKPEKNLSGDDELVDGVDVQTLAITGTMKNAVFNSQMVVVDSAGSSTGHRNGNVDTVFEWVRDAAFSGWGYKWPMLRQKAGLRTKRFFILRNDLLSYHAREPRSKEEAHADYAMHSLRLRPGSTVTATRRYLQDCLEVATPVDTLWFKSANKKNHSRWMSLIEASIDHYSRGPIFVTKDRVECAWQHEIPECCCIAVDADVPIVGTFVRVSLFRIEADDAKKGIKNSSKNSASQLQAPSYTHLIDYNRTGDIEPTIVPLIIEPGVILTCLKLVGEDCVLLGGTSGYIGVCDYGDSVVMSRQFEGHSVDSAVVCIATCSKRNLAVCGDDGGGLSLWMCTNSAERVHCITVIGGESTGRSAVNSIQFVPDRDLVVVSTRAQFLLFGLRVSPDTGRDELEGVTVLDVNSLFVSLSSDISPIKSMPSFGIDPTSEIFHCHCLAFPNRNDSTGIVRHDFGGLKTYTSTPPKADNSDEAKSSALPLVVWKISGAPSQGGEPAGQASVWRIECDYDWIDSRVPNMMTVSKFAAERNVRRTLSGNIVNQPSNDAGVAADNRVNYSVDVDFTVVHQV